MSSACLLYTSTLTDNEAYTLAVNAKGVTIKGKTAQGVFWGLMTLDLSLIHI